MLWWKLEIRSRVLVGVEWDVSKEQRVHGLAMKG
jgi:hypothetical protein